MPDPKLVFPTADPIVDAVLGFGGGGAFQFTNDGMPLGYGALWNPGVSTHPAYIDLDLEVTLGGVIGRVVVRKPTGSPPWLGGMLATHSAGGLASLPLVYHNWTVPRAPAGYAVVKYRTVDGLGGLLRSHLDATAPSLPIPAAFGVRDPMVPNPRARVLPTVRRETGLPISGTLVYPILPYPGAHATEPLALIDPLGSVTARQRFLLDAGPSGVAFTPDGIRITGPRVQTAPAPVPPPAARPPGPQPKTPAPPPVAVVRVGGAAYRLSRPAEGRFAPPRDGTPGRYRVEGFDDLAIGTGPTADAARRDWGNRLHALFQGLYRLQDFERSPAQQAAWDALARLIDVEDYRKRDSVVGREVGKVVRTGRSGKLIEWEGGAREKVRYARAPGELAAAADGTWVQAMVARHPDTYKLRRVLWLAPHSPWSGRVDDAHRAKIDRIPSVSALPETTWD